MAAQPGANQPNPSFPQLSGTSLLRAFVEFGHFLRGRGYATVNTQAIDLSRAAGAVGFARPADVRIAARAIYAKNRAQSLEFDEIFDDYWLGRRTIASRKSVSRIVPHPAREPVPVEAIGLEAAAIGLASNDGNGGAPADEAVRAATYSPIEVLQHMDFEAASSDELLQIRRLIAQMKWKMNRRRARRLKPSGSPGTLDMRRIVRSTIRDGGEPARLFWRRPKIKPRPLILLCDISGSMEQYSRILITFSHALQRGLRDVEIFVFGTRLTRITRVLRNHRVDEALQRVASSVVDWSSGTRIGESIHQFNRIWARRILGRGAVVMIASDGWDRGDVSVLASEMRYLQRSAFRLIWLNPLLGQHDYEPLTLGMQAALPYVDDFLAVHNLASLDQLGILLANVSGSRPPRGSSGPPDSP